VVENREKLPKENLTESQHFKVWNEFLESLKQQRQIPSNNAYHTTKVS